MSTRRFLTRCAFATACTVFAAWGPLAASALAAEAPRPVRVLFTAPDGGSPQAAAAYHSIIEALGRDAIFVDWLEEAQATPELMAAYDVVVKASEAPDAEAVRSAVETRTKTEVKEAWRKFLTTREPEKRRPSPDVANYEKRPEAVTFQEPLSVAGSMARTQVPADLELQLFAAEPDIRKPIAFAWDDCGRLWVAETSDYPHGVAPDGHGGDAIRICEDTDGDGRADTFKIFADKLNIPTGLVLARGGVIVSQPPRFLFLKDTDGDDKADTREEIMTGWGIGDTHAQAAQLHYGYDNLIYGTVGYSGYRGKVKGGEEKGFGQGMYRLKPDGSDLEFLHQFTNNTWGFGYNAAGDLFGGTANNAPSFFCGLPATIVPDGLKAMTAKKINVEDKAHAITPNYRQVDVFGGYTAAAGHMFIESASLPARLQGQAMVCEPTMKLIALMDIDPQGAGYVAKDGFNLLASTDEWMSPVYAEVGPDGAIWLADWQNFIIQHNPTPKKDFGGYDAKTGVGGAHENPLRDHERGRIYRIVAKGSAPKKVAPLAGAPVAALVDALDSDTQVWRLTAQRLLVEGQHWDATEALNKRVLANDGSVAAIHALWALHGLGTLDAATHRAALMAKDARLRRNAIRALATDAAAQALFFGSGVISDPDLQTRLAAYVKLAEFPTTPPLTTAAAAIAASPETQADEWLREASKVLSKKHGGVDAPAVALRAGDPARGEEIFLKHPTGACVLCHALKGQGSAVGPPMDGVGTRLAADALRRSMLEPNAELAKGYEYLQVSPMPPMGLVLQAQEIEDVLAFLGSLK
jgi:putative membrane-bound dehydrogenase-like protein